MIRRLRRCRVARQALARERERTALLTSGWSFSASFLYADLIVFTAGRRTRDLELRTGVVVTV